MIADKEPDPALTAGNSEPSAAAQLRDDIAYMRALAEEGRTAPLISGVYYVIWGEVGVVAGGWQYLTQSGLIAAPGWSIAAAWFGLGALAVAVTNLLHPRVAKKPGALSLGNRIEQAVWAGGGAAIGVFAASAVGTALLGEAAPLNALLRQNYAVFTLIPSVVMLVYGVALLTSAQISQNKMLGRAGLGAFIFAALLTVTAGAALQALIFVIASVLVSILPGAILLREEPKDVV